MPRSDTQAKRPSSGAGFQAVLQSPWLTSDRLVWACGVVLAAATLGVQAAKYPDFTSFWAGLDQRRVLEAARAWSVLDLSPARHYYLPWYPLLGAAFVRLTPWQPFLLPDLGCLLASLALFVRIGRRLVPTWPDSVAAMCFVVAVLSGRTAFAVWVVPWSTTGSAPLQFATLLVALRFAKRPGAARAFALGLVPALIAGFRAGDAAVLLSVSFCFAAVVLMRKTIGVRFAIGMAVAAAAGVLIGFSLLAGVHFAVFGPAAGPYMGRAAGIGLEWRLLPMRWVTIVVGPRPLLPEGFGLAQVLPWVVPGVAGLFLSLLRKPSYCAAPAVLVAAAVSAHWVFYLAFRDLQPYGIWRFYNLNYFKWTFPFLVFWSVQLVVAFASTAHRKRAMLATAMAIALFVWRPVLRDAQAAPVAVEDRDVRLPHGLAPIDFTIGMPLSGSWTQLYFGRFILHAGGRDFYNTRDFKVLPVPNGALLLPLRLLPPGPAILQLPEGVGLPAGSIAVRYRQAIVFDAAALLRPLF